MKKIYAIFFLKLMICSSLYSEIEQITIRWVALRCQDTCGRLLEREFRKISGIQEIQIDLGSGQAILTWKENVPFQFTSINTAMHMVGLSMRDIRLKVTGSIKHMGNHIFIVSRGDNTHFDLVNPVVPHPTGQAAEFNRDARNLSPALRQQLLQGEADKQIATIEGPVFMPERMTVPTSIVVDHLNFKDPKEPEKK